MLPEFRRSETPVLTPQPNTEWADTMVLNPGLIKDPLSNRIHMLFRATGPFHPKRIPDRPLPYPIFLGYAWSDDGGQRWNADFSRPALAPALEYDRDKIYLVNSRGKLVVNYANGCIEDPRLFFIDETLYLTVACRMFPPGPYWEHDDPMQCAPGWAVAGDHHFGRAANENVTVSVLYKVNLPKLMDSQYDQAFIYVCHLTDPEYGENRDVVLFPEKMTVNGKKQYIMLHRPAMPQLHPGITGVELPSIFIAAADEPSRFPQQETLNHLYALPTFDWETERIGASAPPIRISSDEWLLPYHGKKDDVVGYTQSFMILKDVENEFPVITNRCSDRPMYAQVAWEQPGRFAVPCVFTTGAAVFGEDLIIGYGAADERCGLARVNLKNLVEYLKTFSPTGEKV